jgi:multisubunit Na+/H+ antiporter MnhG subunit
MELRIMEKTVIVIGWVFITLLYIAVHHLYNWLARSIGTNDENDFGLQLIFVAVYAIINILYFVFTYHVFNLI